LVLLAGGSPFVSAKTAERLRSTGWEVRTIPGAGHHVHLDDGAAFLSTLLEWSSLAG